MALSLGDRQTLMNSTVMQSRVTGAVIKYALHLLNGSPTEPQEAWANGAIDNPESMARRVSRHLMSDPNFVGSGGAAITGDTWTGGSSITDAQLQGAAEAAINAHFIA